MRCSNNSAGGKLLPKSYPVSPADLWCESTAGRVLDVCGFDVMTV